MDEFEPYDEPQVISYMYDLSDEEFKKAQDEYFKNKEDSEGVTT